MLCALVLGLCNLVYSLVGGLCVCLCCTGVFGFGCLVFLMCLGILVRL